MSHKKGLHVVESKFKRMNCTLSFGKMMETNLEVFFGLKDWRCRKDDAFGSQEPLEGKLEWLSHLLPLLHPQVDFNLTSNELSSNGSKTRPSVFPGFTSYTIGPWKKTNINSL